MGQLRATEGRGGRSQWDVAEAGADAWVLLWNLLAHCELWFPQGGALSPLTGLWRGAEESSDGCGQITARMHPGLHPGPGTAFSTYWYLLSGF